MEMYIAFVTILNKRVYIYIYIYMRSEIMTSSFVTEHINRFDAFFDILRLRQNGGHFADDIFKRILFNENASIAIKMSLQFVANHQINNIPAFVQIMAWRRPGDKP